MLLQVRVADDGHSRWEPSVADQGNEAIPAVSSDGDLVVCGPGALDSQHFTVNGDDHDSADRQLRDELARQGTHSGRDEDAIEGRGSGQTQNSGGRSDELDFACDTIVDVVQTGLPQ